MPYIMCIVFELTGTSEYMNIQSATL